MFDFTVVTQWFDNLLRQTCGLGDFWTILIECVVLELMKELARSGMTMVCVTHEMGFAREVASRVIFIDEGVVKVDKPPKEFFANPENERLKAFLSKVL